jgi:hypothetical protein
MCCLLGQQRLGVFDEAGWEDKILARCCERLKRESVISTDKKLNLVGIGILLYGDLFLCAFQ